MQKKMSRILALLMLLNFPISSGAEADKIAVSVNGADITESDVQRAVSIIVPATVFHGTITPEKREQFRKTAIDTLIEKELLYQEGNRLGLSVKKAEIKEIFNANKAIFKKSKDFYSALEKQGLTESGYKKYIEKELIVRLVLKQEVEEKAKLPESYLEKYYNENMQKFYSPEKIRLREVSITVPPTATAQERQQKRKAAEELINRIKAGEDFAGIASKYSEDAYSVKGGDLGLVHKGRLMLELDDAAAKLKLGEVSGLIETIHGYHIIKLEEIEAGKQLAFSEVKDSLKKELETKRYKDIKDALIKGLKEKAKIESY